MRSQNFQARYGGSIPPTRFSGDTQGLCKPAGADDANRRAGNGRFTDAPARISWPTVLLVAAFLCLLWLLTPPDHAIPSNTDSLQQRRVVAIRKTFGPKYGAQAVRVARCESGINPHAVNGQYRGIFQMGASERATYGHGAGAWRQAKAARRYFIASGRDWSPWTCKP